MRVSVLGGGSWGTALAVLLARESDADVHLWARSPAHASKMREARENGRYLPGVRLRESVRPTADLSEAVAGAALVVGALPSAATGEVARGVAGRLSPDATWLSTTKGLEGGTHRRMTEVVADALPELAHVAALSGPSFAEEVAGGQPTAVVVACAELGVARRLQEVLSGPSFRAYATDDVLGVELGGAMKNVIAIAAGMLSGLGLGHDPTAALITRGLHEMTRLSVALGARERTLFGLAGLGDLVLTCTGSLSRNRRLGQAVGSGASLEEALRSVGQVAEGVETTRRIRDIARERGVDVPITDAVAAVLFESVEVAEGIRALMTRDLRDESQ